MICLREAVNTMYDESDLILSPLQQTYRADGKSVRIQIYRMPDTDWTLEVVDEYNNSTAWDDLFVSDAEALREPRRASPREYSVVIPWSASPGNR